MNLQATTSTLAQQLGVKPLTLGLIAASVITLAALGLFASGSHAADATKPGAAKPALTVSLTQPKSSMLTIKLAANGSVAAWQEASVGAEANGLRVAELHANIGDKVKRGQLLASFAAESVQADVALARAAVAEAQANAAEAAANADRARAVQGSGAISAQQVNQYLTQEQTGKARVASAQAQLDAQLLRLKNTQLLAPDSGIISARNASVGSVVGAGTEMFKLIRQGRLEWRGEVTSNEIGRISPGTVVLVTAPGGAQVKGKVRTLAPTVDAATRNGLVYVDLQAAEKGVANSFKPGMYARGEFELGSSGALTVPQTAVVVRDGFSYVSRVGADNRVSQLKVQTGRVVGDQVEIQSGVKAEDKLVASGGGFLSEGDLVRVVDAAKPGASTSNTAPAPVLPASAASK
ncbi:efflux RND transporter periplasmic adaptor subunit [Rhodoferax sp. AJA081-3]|uniref:efflux RND transporter periplasmic adaptor subunit n=1 Tax=Rhodoferax sp. AJA081-3 TaxID=2752316 RepID=UPI001AE060AB|nr:efflux RND transporter periplasmic adaptor subunit [Rhodoferax sp. AJA081-3]QTN29451.1 efflux RND transporter periplasmic adaptor subunit [Rhodoferax sp. AJA081-3]